MNEREWLACEDPHPMLRSLIQRWVAQRRKGKGVPFERLRLFACACLHRIWDLLDQDHRKSVTMIERYARTPRPTTEQLSEAIAVSSASRDRTTAEAERVWRESPDDRRARWAARAYNRAAYAVWEAADEKPTMASHSHRQVVVAVSAVGRLRILSSGGTVPRIWGDFELPFAIEESAAQAVLLRDVIGNPFRPVILDPAWLTPSVEGLAAAIDAERVFDRLPILADALEEAGCTDEDVLDHCRRPGAHALGCWVVDLLLKKT
jgi:hypothetical protein